MALALEAAFGVGGGAAAAARRDGLDVSAGGGDLAALAAGLHLPPAVADPAAYASREPCRLCAPCPCNAQGRLPPPTPSVTSPADRFDVYTGDAEGEHPRLSFAKGTTTLAFRFRGGIVVSVDSRSTQGPYIASQSVKKISAWPRRRAQARARRAPTG